MEREQFCWIILVAPAENGLAVMYSNPDELSRFDRISAMTADPKDMPVPQKGMKMFRRGQTQMYVVHDVVVGYSPPGEWAGGGFHDGGLTYYVLLERYPSATEPWTFAR